MLYGLSGLPQRLIAMPYIGNQITIFYIERGKSHYDSFLSFWKLSALFSVLLFAESKNVEAFESEAGI